MKRRHAIHRSGLILSSAILGPALFTALPGCTSEELIPEELQVFDDEQYLLTRAIADTILPRTDSPSASDVKVPEFMDLLLQDVFESEASTLFLKGLEDFENTCLKKSGQSFTSMTEQEKHTYLTEVDEKMLGATHSDKVPFYATFKQLCIRIYYSTEEGIKQNLNYNPIPEGYQGDVALRPGDKVEVGNEM